MSSLPSDGLPLAQDAPAPVTDAVELTVPNLGPSVESATIVAWGKQVGELVAADEPICRLAVNQLQFEVCSTADGELTHLFAVAGASVRSGDSLAEVAPRAVQDADAYGAEPALPAAEPELMPEPAPTPEPIAEPDRVRDEPFYTTEPQPPSSEPDLEPIEIAPDPAAIVELAPPRDDPEPQAAPPVDGSWPTGDDVDWSCWHSPVVRMLAEEHAIDLSQLKGTGTGGRIRKRDVLAHVEDSAHS